MPAAPAQIKKTDWIDFGRCVAILFVIMVHTSGGIKLSPWLKGIAGQGDMGVPLFFILSAYTLFNSYNNRYTADGSSRNLYFFIRRLFRIAPLYTVGAIFYTCVEIYLHGPAVQYWKVIVNILFLNGIIVEAINYIPPGGWSIGTEMLFYLLIPFLFRKVNTLKKAAFFLLIAFFISHVTNICVKLVIEHCGNPAIRAVLNLYEKDLCEVFTVKGFVTYRESTLYFWLPNQLLVFGFGIFLYHLLKKYTVPVNLSRLCLALAILSFAVITRINLSVIKDEKVIPYPGFFHQREYIFAIVFTLFAIGIQGMHLKTVAGKFFKNIGRYSFCMYLCHFAVLEYWGYLSDTYFHLERNNSFFFLSFVIGVTVSYCISLLLHRYEQWGIDQGNKLIKRLKHKKEMAGGAA